MSRDLPLPSSSSTSAPTMHATLRAFDLSPAHFRTPQGPQDGPSFGLELPPLQIQQSQGPHDPQLQLPVIEPRSFVLQQPPPHTSWSSLSIPLPEERNAPQEEVGRSLALKRPRDSETLLPRPTQSSSEAAHSSSQPQPRQVVGTGPRGAEIIRIRQQPWAARACGFGERDRRVIDPPPILSLENASGEDVEPDELSVVHASLWDEAGQLDVTFAEPSNRRAGGRLMGTLVASCISAKDEHRRPGNFFAFPDLSCRSYGRFRLRFALIRLQPPNLGYGSTAPVLSVAMSDVFTVYSASEFPGMRPSSALVRAFRDQGHSIPVKKGKRSGLKTPEDDDS